MSSWGLRGRYITRAESLQARATHALPPKPQLLMSPCCRLALYFFTPSVFYIIKIAFYRLK